MAFDPLFLPTGTLRHVVTIQSRSTIPDSFGQTNTWVDLLTVRASLQQITARSMYQSGSLSTQASHKLRMRFPGSSYTIKPGYQIIYGSHVYKIVNVDNILERNRVYELLLLEINGKN